MEELCAGSKGAFESLDRGRPLGGAYDVFCAGVRFEEDPNSKSNPHRYTLKMEKSGKLKFYMRSSVIRISSPKHRKRWEWSL